MEGRFHVPGGGLREAFRQMGKPEAGVAVARAIANHQHSGGSDAPCEPLEEQGLFVRREIMQQIEEDDVSPTKAQEKGPKPWHTRRTKREN